MKYYSEYGFREAAKLLFSGIKIPGVPIGNCSVRVIRKHLADHGMLEEGDFLASEFNSAMKKMMDAGDGVPKKIKKTFFCPCCGHDITAMLEARLESYRNEKKEYVEGHAANIVRSEVFSKIGIDSSDTKTLRKKRGLYRATEEELSAVREKVLRFARNAMQKGVCETSCE